jgi:hypothetical protein
LKKVGYEASGVTCPGRERSAGDHSDRDRVLVSLFGPIHCGRAYYCRRCGRGLHPFDALTDGGSGLAGFVRMNFNRADLVLILSFWHAASYLEKPARALHPHDEASAVEQAKQWCSLLKAEGGAATLAVLRNWEWPARQSAGLRQQRGDVDGYFGNNLHRMEYPEYLAEGWQGVAESLVLPGFAVAFLASMGIHYVAMRCLRCGGNFGSLVMQRGGLRIDRRLRYCPYCGVGLDEEPPPELSGSSQRHQAAR